ncbi:hypothetical protein [Schleiferilactobacillus harbinensis]|uniref:Uncharacterized protein n=1 Tax=Schleiferilactobacillus harbinensis TaxID=304207 RepID=A0ABU7SZ45_9LACO|nr:hypothetical protein [Schleiferilactobacillus harbinensis]QEU48533.1 hypothetical protein FMM01_15090 [Schleiferilactobacillus harbinensis]
MAHQQQIVWHDITFHYDDRAIPLLRPDDQELLFTNLERDEVIVYFQLGKSGQVLAYPKYGGNLTFVTMHEFRVGLNLDSVLNRPAATPPTYQHMSFHQYTIIYDQRATPFIQAAGADLVFVTRLRDEINAHLQVDHNGQLNVSPGYGVRFVFTGADEMTVALTLDD